MSDDALQRRVWEAEENDKISREFLAVSDKRLKEAVAEITRLQGGVSEKCPICGETKLWNGRACDECGHGEEPRTMGDPSILFVKPKAISQRDKKALQTAGVIVVEVDDVSNIKFTRAHAEIESGELLDIAVRLIKENASDGVRMEFGRAMCDAVLARRGDASLVGE